MLPSAFPDGVGTSDDNDFRAQYPACAYPCQRSTASLTAHGVWLRVGMARYAFPVRLFHPLHLARFTGAFEESLAYTCKASLTICARSMSVRSASTHWPLTGKRSWAPFQPRRRRT